MKMAMGATVCTLLAVVMIVLSIMMPWYMTSTTGSGISATSNIGFSGSTNVVNGNTTTISWANYIDQYKSEYNGTLPKLPGVYATTMYLLVGGMVFALLGIVTGFLAGSGKVKSLVPAIVGILALLLTIGAFAFFLTSHAAALKADLGSDAPPIDGPWNGFAGSATLGGATSTWGGAIGYWLPLVAVLFIVISMMLGMRAMKGTPAAGAPAPGSGKE